MANNKGKIFFNGIWADGDVVKERLRKERPYSEADPGAYHLIKRQWEPSERPHLTLRSTSTNIGAMLQKALQYLKNGM